MTNLQVLAATLLIGTATITYATEHSTPSQGIKFSQANQKQVILAAEQKQESVCKKGEKCSS